MGLLAPFFLSAALHELGHWLVLRMYHIPVTRLQITPLGCVMQTVPLPYRVESRCALAGPAVNVLLLLIFARRSAPPALVNLVLAGFNLLPLWPLDGGRFLRAQLQARLPLSRAQRIESGVAVFFLALVWLGAAGSTCVLHMGLAPVGVAAALTLRAGQEKFVAKKRA